jgi:7-cyano-7-deazaguanine synthase
MVAAAVVLLSGGLDSGTALALWLADPGHRALRCLTFDYGQRSADAEACAAAALAARFSIPWERIALPWLAAAALASGSALASGGPAPPRRAAADPGDAASAAAVWVPARNLVLVAAAAAIAESLGAGILLTGFNSEEAATFPDNSPAFVAACDAVLALGTQSRVRVQSPTLHLDKAGIVAAARAAGLGPGDFWSCYGGGRRPCGHCESCARSARAWGAAGQRDMG